MEIKILDKNEIDEIVANRICELVNQNPNTVLGLATGSTPLGVYDKIVKNYQNKYVSFKDVTTFNLDEYVGLTDTHEQSYRHFMTTNLFNHIDIKKENTNFPDNTLTDPSIYDKKIKNAGGIDFQILGIGSNGHIAFNEPGTDFNSVTHVVKLADSTIKDNARFFDNINDVPKMAVTMGLKSILDAKEIVLIATGKNKAHAISKLLKDAPSEDLPSSILKNHKNVTIYCDEDAVSLIN